MAKVKEITKEQQEELFEQGRKEGKEDFLQKIANTGIQGASAIYNMKVLRLTCDFMVYKGYKIKICLSSMSNQPQDSRSYLFFYQSSCHQPSRYFS